MTAETFHRQAKRARPHSAEYEAYLQSPEWRERRRRTLERDGYRCRVCNSPDNLDAHHRTYERFGEELDEDLTTLCRRCHDFFHDIERSDEPLPDVEITYVERDGWRVPRFVADSAGLGALAAYYEHGDLALARVAAVRGATDQDLCDLIVARNLFDPERGGRVPSTTYIKSTIRKARMAPGGGALAYGVMPGAAPPVDKLRALLINCADFAALWSRQRPDFYDQQHRYDMGLARIAVDAGWSDPEIVALIGLHREWDAQCLGGLYLATTIAKARTRMP